MADYNAWNETMKRRGAVEALEALRDDIANRYEGAGVHFFAGLIDQHLNKYKYKGPEA